MYSLKKKKNKQRYNASKCIKRRSFSVRFPWFHRISLSCLPKLIIFTASAVKYSVTPERYPYFIAVYILFYGPFGYSSRLFRKLVYNSLAKYMTRVALNQCRSRTNRLSKTKSGIHLYLSRAVRKRVLCHMRTTKAQISLRIRAV